jgi:hypothetical protein
LAPLSRGADGEVCLKLAVKEAAALKEKSIDRDYDDPIDGGEAPLFGCACEGALCADAVCDGCIEAMKDQDASGKLWRAQNHRQRRTNRTTWGRPSPGGRR